jgi:hypothetical protein
MILSNGISWLETPTNTLVAAGRIELPTYGL